MALKWNTVRAEHVRAACDMVAAGKTRKNISGLVVWHNEQALPAKEVLRSAYRLANNLAADEEVNFSSGDATLRLLTTLGFSAERIGSKRTRAAEDNAVTNGDA
jgi:hypothetical protein